MTGPKRLRFLFSARENYPAYRVDITDLFSRGIAARGHEIDWVMQSDTPSQSRLLRIAENERVFLGSSAKGKGITSRLLNSWWVFLNDLRLARLVLTGRYDFVQVRDKFFAALLALSVAKIKKVPFFYWMSFPYPEADLNRVREDATNLTVFWKIAYLLRGRMTALALYKVILPFADHVFVQSQKMLEAVASKGIPPTKMTPVPMGILLSRISSDEIRPSDDARLDGKRPIVYVGTLVAERKIEFLFHVMKLLLDKHPDALLVLVGGADETQMRHLAEEAERAGVANTVLFTGFLPMEQAWGYIRAADVCVSYIRPHPILDVGTPTKVLEYLAWNRPVVANDHPDQVQVLQASGAGIAVQSSPKPFAEAIERLLSDRALAEGMAQRGREYVSSNRSYVALTDMVEQHYYAILGRRELKAASCG